MFDIYYFIALTIYIIIFSSLTCISKIWCRKVLKKAINKIYKTKDKVIREM